LIRESVRQRSRVAHPTRRVITSTPCIELWVPPSARLDHLLSIAEGRPLICRLQAGGMDLESRPGRDRPKLEW
jgi:hypothetical protein